MVLPTNPDLIQAEASFDVSNPTEIEGGVSYAATAREAIPRLQALIVHLHDQCNKGEFPTGEFNDRQVAAVPVSPIARDRPELRATAAVEQNR